MSEGPARGVSPHSAVPRTPLGEQCGWSSPSQHCLTTRVGAQLRTFTFDNRGFLTAEDLPEKTVPTGQSHDVAYSNYDAAGHAGRVVDGPNDLTTTYDRAGRPTNVKITGSTSLIDLAYATANVAGDYRNGKLRTATRHNWIGSPAVDNQVVETYTYL